MHKLKHINKRKTMEKKLALIICKYKLYRKNNIVGFKEIFHTFIDVIRVDGNVHQFVYNYTTVTDLFKSTQQIMVTKIYKIDFE